MMNFFQSFFLLLAFVSASSAFLTPPQVAVSPKTSLNLMIAAHNDVPQPPPTHVVVATEVSYSSSFTSPMDQGVQSYLKQGSTTQSVALQDRKIPTAEEIAEKKRNFNLIFWGGGFVAPFIATVFYFGPKFWTK